MLPEQVNKTVRGMSGSASDVLNRVSSDRSDETGDGDVLLSFGAISDVQCGDLANRMTPGLANRYYRGALTNLGEAVKSWNQRRPAPSFVMQLGDVLDGANAQQGGKDQSRRVLGNVLKECSEFKGYFHHVLGNHEFYNFTRLELLNSPLFSGRTYLETCHQDTHQQSIQKTPTLKSRECKSSNHTPVLDLSGSIQDVNNDNNADCITDETIPAYYDFSPVKGFRFISLDTFDISVLGYTNDESPGKVAAHKILDKYTKDSLKNISQELVGKEQRFISCNGGIGQEQLKWLKGVLNRAMQNKEKVVVFGHVPIYPGVTSDDCLVWNYQEVLSLLQSSQCVIATLFGHTHRYRYHADETGIHHFILPGVVECEPGTNGFMTFDILAECMVVHRAGELTHLRLKYYCT